MVTVWANLGTSKLYLKASVFLLSRITKSENNPEKVFGVSNEWAEKNPNTHLAVVKALIRAAKWLDENNNANRKEAVKMLSKPEYVGADYDVIANSMTGTFEFEKGDKREIPDFNVFYRYYANYPFYPTLSGTSLKCVVGVRFQMLSLTAGTKKLRKKFTSQKFLKSR